MAVGVQVITQDQWLKIGYGPKQFKKAILNAEATAYGYYEYKNKKTSQGVIIQKKHINNLIAVDKKNIKIGDSLEIYSKSTKKLVFKGVAGDYCASKPRRSYNAVLIDCFLDTAIDCDKFGRRDVIIFII